MLGLLAIVRLKPAGCRGHLLKPATARELSNGQERPPLVPEAAFETGNVRNRAKILGVVLCPPCSLPPQSGQGLGVVIGSIVMAMFLPIFNLAGVVSG